MLCVVNDSMFGICNLIILIKQLELFVHLDFVFTVENSNFFVVFMMFPSILLLLNV